MTQKEMFEKSFQRPKNYFELSDEKKWEIDEQLGILDWDGENLSEQDLERYWNHYSTLQMDEITKNLLEEFSQDFVKLDSDLTIQGVKQNIQDMLLEKNEEAYTFKLFFDKVKVDRLNNQKLKSSIESYLQGAPLDVLYEAIGQAGDIPNIPNPIKELEETKNHSIKLEILLDNAHQGWRRTIDQLEELKTLIGEMAEETEEGVYSLEGWIINNSTIYPEVKKLFDVIHSYKQKKNLTIFENGCSHCIDPDGEPCLPHPGLAPHNSFNEKGEVIKSEFTDENDNCFVPDKDDLKIGTWYCPTPGCPNSKEKQIT